jgi:hypothetical protein
MVPPDFLLEGHNESLLIDRHACRNQICDFSEVISVDNQRSRLPDSMKEEILEDVRLQ